VVTRAGLLNGSNDAYVAAVQKYRDDRAALDDTTIDAFNVDTVSHCMCETNEGWRPCPSSLCEIMHHVHDKDSPAHSAERHDGAETPVTFATDAEKLLARGFKLRETNSTGR
jgi:hypothetical protein